MSSSRPARTPRSTAIPVPSAPATRSRKPTAAVDVPPTTTRKAAWNGSTTDAASVKTIRTAPKSAVKPLWGSSKANIEQDSTPARTHNNAPARKLSTAPPTVNAAAIAPEPLRASAGDSENDTRTTVDFEKRGVDGYDPTREPIHAYLRIRPPPPNAPSADNYLQVLNASEVLMAPPVDHRHNPTSTSSFFSAPLLRSTLASDPQSLGTVYKFTRVFSPTTLPTVDTQDSFFRETTLPLVHDFLAGQNCLLYAYGTSGSGKTHTVQGGEGENAGLLPRVMDVVWRSLEGKESKSLLRPSRLAGVELTPPSMRIAVDGRRAPISSTPTRGATGLGIQQSSLDEILRKSFAQNDSADVPDAVPVDDAYEYSVWVSYAEIYNEKIYDLLESPFPQPPSSASSQTSSVFHAGLGLLGVGGIKAKLNKSFQTVKRTALSLKHDTNAGNKYVAGMREIRVHSAAEARTVLDKGQAHRRVFSTLANRASSRSHSIFTIKIIRILKGAGPEDAASATTSRFSIVDLAGSERLVNTGASGDRLKEAGNINTSLMALGQCMEVLRKNQELEKGRKPAIVPFRHSKLTELFQSFFVGDGKVVMIVNVNPFETGFDENSHVMRFSAVAKGLMTIKNNVPVPVLAMPVVPVVEEPRLVRLSMIDGGEEEDVFYEEEDAEMEDDDDEDEFVKALLEELSVMRTALYQAEMQIVLVESQTKSRVAQEYDGKLLAMERHFQECSREQAREAEIKLDAKLDILTRLHAARAQPSTPSTMYDDSDKEQESEGEESEEEVERLLLEEEEGSSLVERSLTLEIEDSPAALAAVRTSDRAAPGDFDSPLPASKMAVSTLGADVEEEEQEEDDLEEDDDENEEGVSEELDVPLQAESSTEEAESDDYVEEDDEASEDDYVPAPRALTAEHKARGSAASTKSVAKVKAKVVPTSPEYDVLVEIQSKAKKTVVRAPVEEVEEMALDKSIVIRPGASKKPKRKLDGHKIKDVEDLDLITETFSPVVVATTKPLTKSASIRSLSRR